MKSTVPPDEAACGRPDIERCQGFVRFMSRPAVAFVCTDTNAGIVATGTHTMSALQLMATANAILTSAAEHCHQCGCDACGFKAERIRLALKALNLKFNDGRVH